MAKSGELAARLNQQLNSDSPVRTRTPEQQHYDVSSLESYKLINLCVILYHYVLFCIIMYCFVSLCTVLCHYVLFIHHQPKHTFPDLFVY